MKSEARAVVFDNELKIEAYRFDGIIRPFPNHFHEHYTIGLIESGKRILSCKGKEYVISKGNVILFNPGDNHSCRQSDNRQFDFKGINIPKSIMLALAEEITKKRKPLFFSQNVIIDDEIALCISSLHKMIMNKVTNFEKEENLIFLISSLIQKYTQPTDESIPEYLSEIEKACLFLKENYNKKISLDMICEYVGLGKSTLLRAFTKAKGITPYRYLEAIRISNAKHLLEQGSSPVEAALQTGFSDQSHFTNYFVSFIGLTPGAYKEIFSKKEKEIKGLEK